MTTDPNELNYLHLMIAKKRKKNAFWKWPDRQVEERGIATEILREALINAKMRSFAVQADVFLVKAGSSQRRVGADGLVRRTQMSCGRDTGLRAPTARTPGPRSW